MVLIKKYKIKQTQFIHCYCCWWFKYDFNISFSFLMFSNSFKTKAKLAAVDDEVDESAGAGLTELDMLTWWLLAEEAGGQQ